MRTLVALVALVAVSVDGAPPMAGVDSPKTGRAPKTARRNDAGIIPDASTRGPSVDSNVGATDATMADGAMFMTAADSTAATESIRLEVGGAENEESSGGSTNTGVLIMALCLTLLVSALVVVTRQWVRRQRANLDDPAPLKTMSISDSPAPIPGLEPIGEADEDSAGLGHAWQTPQENRVSGRRRSKGRKSSLNMVVNNAMVVPRSPRPVSSESGFGDASFRESNGVVYFVPRSPEDGTGEVEAGPAPDNTGDEDPFVVGAAVMQRSPPQPWPVDAATTSTFTATDGAFGTAVTMRSPPTEIGSTCNDRNSTTPISVDTGTACMARSPVDTNRTQGTAADAQMTGFTMRTPPSQPNQEQLYEDEIGNAVDGQFCTARSPVEPAVQSHPEYVYNLIPRDSVRRTTPSPETATTGASYFTMRSPTNYSEETESEEPQQVIVTRSPAANAYGSESEETTFAAHGFTMRSPQLGVIEAPTGTVPEPEGEETTFAAHGGFTMRSPQPDVVETATGTAAETEDEQTYETAEEGEEGTAYFTMRSPVERVADLEAKAVTPDEMANPFMPTTIELASDNVTDPASSPQFRNEADSESDFSEPDTSMPLSRDALAAAEEFLASVLMNAAPKSPTSTEASVIDRGTPLVNEPPTPTEAAAQPATAGTSGKKRTPWAAIFRPEASITAYPPDTDESIEEDLPQESSDFEASSVETSRVDVATETSGNTSPVVEYVSSANGVEWGPNFFTQSNESTDSPDFRGKRSTSYFVTADAPGTESPSAEGADRDTTGGDPEGLYANETGSPLHVEGHRAADFSSTPATAAMTPAPRTAKRFAPRSVQGTVPMTAPRQGQTEKLLKFWSPWARGAPEAIDFDPVVHTPAQPRNTYQRAAGGLAFPTIAEVSSRPSSETPAKAKNAD